MSDGILYGYVSVECECDLEADSVPHVTAESRAAFQSCSHVD